MSGGLTRTEQKQTESVYKAKNTTSIPWMDCEAQLTSTCHLTCKVGQTNLVIGVRSGFISRSADARLQVSAYSGYDLFHARTHTHTHTDDRQHFDQLI